MPLPVTLKYHETQSNLKGQFSKTHIYIFPVVNRSFNKFNLLFCGTQRVLLLSRSIKSIPCVMCSLTCSPYGALDGDIKTTALVYVWQIQRGPRFPRKHSSVQYRQWSRCCRRSVESEWVIMICGLHCCDMHWVSTEWIWHADIHINQFTHKGMDASADTDLDFLPCWIRNLKVKLISLVKLQGLSGCRSPCTPVCERAFVWTAASISLCLFNSHEAPGVFEDVN